MKHHCHCGIDEHLRRLRGKKVGLLGLTLMGLHILFHVVECLVLPAAFIALGGHAVEEQAAATSGEVQTVDPGDEEGQDSLASSCLVSFEDSLWAAEPQY